MYQLVIKQMTDKITRHFEQTKRDTLYDTTRLHEIEQNVTYDICVICESVENSET